MCKIIGWYRIAAASIVTVLTFVTSLIVILFFAKRKLIILRVRVFVSVFFLKSHVIIADMPSLHNYID